MRQLLKVLLFSSCCFFILNLLPHAQPWVEIQEPADNITTSNCGLYFNWVLNPAGNPTSYIESYFQIEEDSGFMVLRQYTIYPTDYTNSCPVSWWPDNTVISWRVQIRYSSWFYEHYTSWSGRTFTTNFPGLEIQNPANNAASVGQTPTFSWSDYMNGDFSYMTEFKGGWEFLLSDRLDFQDTLFIDTLPYAIYTGWTFPETVLLSAGKEFYWKVKCYFYMGIGGWTNTGHFTTGCTTPHPPILLLPTNGAEVELHESAVDLYWYQIINNEHFIIEIDEDDQFLSPVVSANSGGDGYTFNGAVEGATYFWHVKTDYDCGTSDWSETRSFVVHCPKPSAPIPTSPADGIAGLDPEQVYLQWQDVDRADLFYLEVDDDDDFSSPVFVSQTDQLNDFCTGLTGAVTFYWRVRGYHQTCGYGNWSPVWNFGIKEPTDYTDHYTSNLPQEYRLKQNIPNPFNPSTVIGFDIPRAGVITIEIGNLLGEKIAILTDRRYPAGSWSVIWDGRDSRGNPVPSGVYLCCLKAENHSESIKMMLVK